MKDTKNISVNGDAECLFSERGLCRITNDKFELMVNDQMSQANKELKNGYELVKKYPRSVSILGSARFKEGHQYYEMARSLSKKIVEELGYAVATGGGPGIMEAANRGAIEAKGNSLGFSIILPTEQKTNPYVTESVDFEYFFSRKTLLLFAAEVYIYYPGGFGTLDELFELLTLIQTKEISQAPIVLIGREFWEPLLSFIEKTLLQQFDTISNEDLKMFKIVDSEDEVIEIIKNAPVRIS
jgi:uncharacterized protein (TIGR00730 family)